MRTIMRDAHSALLRAVREIVEREPALARLSPGDGLPALTVAGVEAERWASATFSGQRHQLDLVLRGARDRVEAVRGAISARLEGAEFDLPGHLVADIAMTSAIVIDEGTQVRCEMRFEALTVED